MFYFFEEFEELFDGTNKSESSLTADDSVNSDYVKEEISIDNYHCDDDDFVNENNIMPEVEMTAYEEDSNPIDPVYNQNHIKPSEIERYSFKAHNEDDKSTMMKLQLDYSNGLREKELKLQRDRLEFEREKLKQEMLIRQKEIESQERLKILELEMKERIAVCDVKMRENVALKALERRFDCNEL